MTDNKNKDKDKDILPHLCGTCGKPITEHSLADRNCTIVKVLKEVWQRHQMEGLE